MSKRELALIHPFNFTFIPDSWDQGSLFYSTNNGGKKMESYKLKIHLVIQKDIHI